MVQKVSIYDIAKLAGVSPSTVSNVINGRTSKMSKETKEKVLYFLEKTEYRANLAARNLVTGKSKLIGICLPIIELEATQSDLLENNPFYHEFIDGLQRVFLKQGYECLIKGLDSDFKYLDWIQNRSFDGLIDLGHLSNDIHVELNKLKVPIVYVDNYDSVQEGVGKDIIVSDDEYGAYIATKHLLELGHTGIGFVHTLVNVSGVDRERYKGYKKALAEKGINEEFLYPSIMDYSHGISFGHRLVEESLPITAIFCTADITAFGIAHGVKEAGKSVPEDYSLVGFDDIKMTQYMSPRLTTVKQRILDKSIACANVLLDKINNPLEHTPERLVLKPELVIRETTRKI